MTLERPTNRSEHAASADVSPPATAPVQSSAAPLATTVPASADGARATPPSEVTPAPSPETRLAQLRALLRQMGSVLVCYSGGIDSALVLAVAHEQLADRALAITAVSPSLAPRERADAARLARHIGARHELVDSHEIDRPQYAANGPDRCFHCKSELYDLARAKLAQLAFSAIVNGTNCDDLGDYRPGLEAARLAGVRSPLVELGFDKAAVRAVAKLLELPIWDKPASACLSSRIPYGTAVTRERLAQIAGFEQDLADLGFRGARVRWHGKIARLELAVSELPRALEPELRARLITAGKRQGFNYVTLDLEGYRVGSHNEVLVGHSLRVIQ